MTATPLRDPCQRARPKLASLGELGRPLLDTVVVIERVGGECDVEARTMPCWRSMCSGSPAVGDQRNSRSVIIESRGGGAGGPPGG